MILVNQSYKITRWDPEVDLREICDAARTCYKSSDLESRESQERFISHLINRDKEHPHLSPLEHSILSVKFITNRGVTHELVRHRLTSVNQESTRYCNYSKEKFSQNVKFILDTSVVNDPQDYKDWFDDCEKCEYGYFKRLAKGWTPDRARGVLNNDVASEIKITANYREWRHIFNLRCDDKHAHYQMVELMTPLLKEVATELPCIFGDIAGPHGYNVL